MAAMVKRLSRQFVALSLAVRFRLAAPIIMYKSMISDSEYFPEDEKKVEALITEFRRQLDENLGALLDLIAIDQPTGSEFTIEIGLEMTPDKFPLPAFSSTYEITLLERAFIEAASDHPGVSFQSLSRSLDVVRVQLIRPAQVEIKEQLVSPETVSIRYSNKCGFCGHEIVIVENVSLEDKPRKIKRDKKRGRYRDWDYPEMVECECYDDNPTNDGKPKHRQVQLFYREWETEDHKLE